MLPLQCGNSKKFKSGEGICPSLFKTPPPYSNTTQTTCKLRVTAGSYQHSNYRAIFSNDSLKCYHYSVEIQKNLNRGGGTSPSPNPSPCSALRASPIVLQPIRRSPQTQDQVSAYGTCTVFKDTETSVFSTKEVRHVR